MQLFLNGLERRRLLLDVGMRGAFRIVCRDGYGVH